MNFSFLYCASRNPFSVPSFQKARHGQHSPGSLLLSYQFNHNCYGQLILYLSNNNNNCCRRLSICLRLCRCFLFLLARTRSLLLSIFLTTSLRLERSSRLSNKNCVSNSIRTSNLWLQSWKLLAATTGPLPGGLVCQLLPAI